MPAMSGKFLMTKGVKRLVLAALLLLSLLPGPDLFSEDRPDLIPQSPAVLYQKEKTRDVFALLYQSEVIVLTEVVRLEARDAGAGLIRMPFYLITFGKMEVLKGNRPVQSTFRVADPGTLPVRRKVLACFRVPSSGETELTAVIEGTKKNVDLARAAGTSQEGAER